jgi:hypothetical protein
MFIYSLAPVSVCLSLSGSSLMHYVSIFLFATGQRSPPIVGCLRSFLQRICWYTQCLSTSVCAICYLHFVSSINNNNNNNNNKLLKVCIHSQTP